MTDYLELIFSTPAAKPVAPAAADLTEPGANRTEPELSWPELSTAIPEHGESFWQQEALRRIGQALDIPEPARSFPSISRPVESREGEGLERRLRRDSRRYDGGFYLY